MYMYSVCGIIDLTEKKLNFIFVPYNLNYNK